MEQETKFSALSKLIDLEGVVNTRTPVWNIGGNGDIRVKLDTDVNGQEWYVLTEAERGIPLEGMVSCWAFPHFNGAYDQYAYEPVGFCFKTFAELLANWHTESVVWAYDVDEHVHRLEMITRAEVHKRRQEKEEREQAEIDAMPPRTVEMSEQEYRQYQDWLKGQNSDFDPFLDETESEKLANAIPLVFRQAFDEQPADPHEQLGERMKLWGLDQVELSSLPEGTALDEDNDNKPQP